MHVRIQPLSDALGAEVIGFELSNLRDEETISLLRDSFLAYHLLCFRMEPLSPSNFFSLGNLFGTPQLQLIRHERNTAVPEVALFVSTYEKESDKPDDLNEVRLSGWHTDDSYFEIPAKATLLQGLDIPTIGGQTRFCNTQSAYEDLPKAFKSELYGKNSVHKYETNRAVARPKNLSSVEALETPDVIHPLVRTHDETGNQAVYYNSNRTASVVGMSPDESDALLDHLGEYITQNKYRYDHDWQVGDVLFWDNRCLIHSVNVDYPVGQDRRHQRILLKGSRPI
jgi:taurine dioxygenase